MNFMVRLSEETLVALGAGVNTYPLVGVLLANTLMAKLGPLRFEPSLTKLTKEDVSVSGELK